MQNSKVMALYLGSNNITDKATKNIIQNPHQSQIKYVNLEDNNITKNIRKELIKTYSKIQWVF